MDSIAKAMMAASHGMRAQSHRLQIASENLSNVDTHGYLRKQITFSDTFDDVTGQNLVRVEDVSLDQTEGSLVYEPGHALANDEGFVLSSNVDFMIEMADAREANRSYEANLTSFRQAAQMYSGLIDLLRR